ncbi:MAG: chromosome segregation protein SMC, partial [Planctomycetaceae bacterium]|nr:chromosome segregation protein SMC [Planctomycetaceae bacterium]
YPGWRGDDSQDNSEASTESDDDTTLDEEEEIYEAELVESSEVDEHEEEELDEDDEDDDPELSDHAGDRIRQDLPEYEDIRDDLEEQVNRLRRKLKALGSVDTESLSTLEEMETRYTHMHSQLADLTEAKRTLEDIVRRINTESKRMFVETFELVRGHFQHLFRKAFGGGDGDIVLEDPSDVLECGIEMVARPPGKDLKSISLMSGGEKALTAFALLLALFKTRPSPYCLLDEVDAPLDEANVGRLGALLEEFKGDTQFIVITHKKPTMTIADVIYGVTMEQSGVSKRMSVRFEDVNEHGEFKTDGDEEMAAAA